MSYGKERIVVVGAGIVGASLALYLKKAGKDVLLLDTGVAGGGASFGNAGQISPDTCVPDVIPGIISKIPGWLTDPLGPLVVRASYLPRAVPWLLRSARSGGLDEVLKIADKIRSLHKNAFGCYRELLGDRFDSLIKVNGQIYFWQDDPTGKAASIRDIIAERVGASVEPLPLEDLYQMIPSLTRNIKKAVIMKNNGNTVNSFKLVQTIADEFVSRGGELRAETVMKLLPEEDGFRVVTNVGNYRTRQVAVCAGAFSQRLLAPLGYRLPLESERGYHVTIHKPNIDPPRIPVICMDRPAAATPVDAGIRCAGTVEFAGLDRPLDEARAGVLLKRITGILPQLKIDEHSIWMGHRPSFPDSMPVVEQSTAHPGLFLGFGHGMAGMTGGPPTARALCELMLGREPFISLAPFASARFGK
ncbi:FAD-binding oxidoreductase [Azospirillum sp. A26]|uniref:NAD(P)/FAD-dependent oxidoreductase n=1 Tax=Azospirillum sp. A26 TaxID=3160607 RepID=UPI00366AC8AD